MTCEPDVCVCVGGWVFANLFSVLPLIELWTGVRQPQLDRFGFTLTLFSDLPPRNVFYSLSVLCFKFNCLVFGFGPIDFTAIGLA